MEWWQTLISVGIPALATLLGILLPLKINNKREDAKRKEDKEDKINDRFDKIEKILDENFERSKKSFKKLEDDTTKAEISRLRDEFNIWYNLLKDKTEIDRADYEKIEDIYRKYKNLRYPETNEIPNGTVDRMMNELVEIYRNKKTG